MCITAAVNQVSITTSFACWTQCVTANQNQNLCTGINYTPSSDTCQLLRDNTINNVNFQCTINPNPITGASAPSGLVWELTATATVVAGVISVTGPSQYLVAGTAGQSGGTSGNTTPNPNPNCGCNSNPRQTGPCKTILANNPNATSGVYQLVTPSSNVNYEAYCEMGLNGGGYTFLSPASLTQLSDADIQSMFTDKTSFLMRYRSCSGNQPYAVLSQLPQYSGIPLFIGLSTNTGYSTPVNSYSASLGTYLYFAFLNISSSNNHNTQGLQVNGNQVTFSNCDTNPNSYFALFPNFRELTPATVQSVWPLPQTFVNDFARNPSTRLIPPEYYMFLESLFGGCGWYTQTDSRTDSYCLLGATIGFR